MLRFLLEAARRLRLIRPQPPVQLGFVPRLPTGVGLRITRRA